MYVKYFVLTECITYTKCTFRISRYRRGANEIRALLGFYAAQNGNFLQTFWENLSVPPSRVK